MKILLINTSDTLGGAAIAALRLLKALRGVGLEPTLVVRDAHLCPMPKGVKQVKRPYWWLRLLFFIEALVVYVCSGFKRSAVFQYVPAVAGIDMTTLPEFATADVVHLHWINQGFMSLQSLQKLADSGKPVVWTMHDSWPFTAIRPVAYDIADWPLHDATTTCPEAHEGRGLQWLAQRTYRRKQALFRRCAHWQFVGCSAWMAGLASRSALLGEHAVRCIHNPIDTTRFSPGDQAYARQRWQLPDNRLLLLFVAYNVTAHHKGYDLLCEALHILQKENPELHSELGLILVGKEATTMASCAGVPTFAHEFISDTDAMISLYQAADTLVMPTRFDNLPNCIAEAMACGLPVVSTHIGGVPEMVDHNETGYIAQPDNAMDLARGIAMTSDAHLHPLLSRMARRKAETLFSETTIATQYEACYHDAITQAHLNSQS